MVVDAIEAVAPSGMDLSLIGVKKVAGGSVTESFLVKGVAFKRTFSYAGASSRRRREGVRTVSTLLAAAACLQVSSSSPRSLRRPRSCC